MKERIKEIKKVKKERKKKGKEEKVETGQARGQTDKVTENEVS